MREQARADASFLVAGENVGVADESDVANLLQAHHAYQGSGVLVAPEHDTFVEFMLELLAGHVGFCPASVGNDSFISAGAIVDDGANAFKILIAAATDHDRPVSLTGIWR